ncbi:uncharacterized protein [Apostichopus japonicus]|uniref:uncharacterized protein n=1 Tax=Stichopus japonicus TaxID=307972 RepID=UPI003AB40CC1
MEEFERLIKSDEENDSPINYGSNKELVQINEVTPIRRHYLYEPPEDYYWLAVASLICCVCLPPFGLLAIYRARQVPRLYFSGDELGAYRASGQAKGFALMSFMLGSMLLITVAILLVNILNLGL